MYVDTHHFTFDDNCPAYSIKELSKLDLENLCNALETVPISPDDRLYRLREMLRQFLASHL